MNTEQFNLAEGGFDILDFQAALDFMTEASVGFDLGQQRTGTFAGFHMPGFYVLGWLDVHYPCADHIKARMRICLPRRYYQNHEQRLQIINAVFKALVIPEDETYSASFLQANEPMSVIQPRDREGATDGFYD